MISHWGGVDSPPLLTLKHIFSYSVSTVLTLLPTFSRPRPLGVISYLKAPLLAMFGPYI